jgi:hypothetical protein
VSKHTRLEVAARQVRDLRKPRAVDGASTPPIHDTARWSEPFASSACPTGRPIPSIRIAVDASPPPPVLSLIVSRDSSPPPPVREPRALPVPVLTPIDRHERPPLPRAPPVPVVTSLVDQEARPPQTAPPPIRRVPVPVLHPIGVPDAPPVQDPPDLLRTTGVDREDADPSAVRFNFDRTEFRAEPVPTPPPPATAPPPRATAPQRPDPPPSAPPKPSGPTQPYTFVWQDHPVQLHVPVDPTVADAKQAIAEHWG